MHYWVPFVLLNFGQQAWVLSAHAFLVCLGLLEAVRWNMMDQSMMNYHGHLRWEPLYRKGKHLTVQARPSSCDICPVRIEPRTRRHLGPSKPRRLGAAPQCARVLEAER